MLAMAALAVGLNSLGSWWQHVQDRWTYGYPRLFQTDAVVGHNHDSTAHPSHFAPVNLAGHIDVFELPAGDPTHLRVFPDPPTPAHPPTHTSLTPTSADTQPYPTPP